MLITAEKTQAKSYAQATERDLAVSRLMQYNQFDDFSDEYQDESWAQTLGADWLCAASDYSVQYKLMDERFHSLHANKVAVDLQRVKRVGDYAMVEITRCTYEILEGQCVRVSVSAKLVFEKKVHSGVVLSQLNKLLDWLKNA